MHKFSKVLLTILLVSTLISSCINQFGLSGPTIGGKKRKNKVVPPYEFSKSVFDYRKERGYWPKSEMDLSAYNSQVIRNLYLQDFSDWYLGSSNEDSLYIHFTHAPVTSNGSIGILPVPVKDLKIRRYMYSQKGQPKQYVKRAVSNDG
jgi:hypothetical protein